jgi:hypothetical protein
MANPLAAFNNKLLEFVEDLSETYSEEKDIRVALDALKMLKKANPKLIHSGFMDYIYPDFHAPVKAEDESILIKKAKEILNSEYKNYAFAYVIFDRHWSTMSESNKKAIWNWCKVIVVLAERAAGITA